MAKAITDALRGIFYEQVKVYRTSPLRLTRFGINRPTWRRLDYAARYWLREIQPDPCISYPGGYSIANAAWLAWGEKHRVTRLYDGVANEWLPLEEDTHLPDGVIEFIFDIPWMLGQTAGHICDITPLLEATPPMPEGW